ncbi:MAG: fluoride efflux transporter CrcB [Pseudomonadota bacterium]|nr:fluoride efflux transporter CrcB [Pseudomonadota bacterium]
MERIILVALGGAAGSVARYLTGVAVPRLIGLRAPWASTFIVNVVGGLAMGFLIGWLAQRGGAGQERARLFLAIGVLGGFTTFSSFSLDAALMIQRRDYGLAGAYVAGSVLLSIGALFAGLMAARRMFA